jgi:hypothetical protein
VTARDWVKTQRISRLTSERLADLERAALADHPDMLAALTITADRFAAAATAVRSNNTTAPTVAEAERTLNEKWLHSGKGSSTAVLVAFFSSVLALAFTFGGNLPGSNFRVANPELSEGIIATTMVIAAVFTIIALVSSLRYPLRSPGVLGITTAVLGTIVGLIALMLASKMTAAPVVAIVLSSLVCLITIILWAIRSSRANTEWSNRNAIVLSTFGPYRDVIWKIYRDSRDELASLVSSLPTAERQSILSDRNNAFLDLLRTGAQRVSLDSIHNRALGELILYARAEPLLGVRSAPPHQ